MSEHHFRRFRFLRFGAVWSLDEEATPDEDTVDWGREVLCPFRANFGLLVTDFSAVTLRGLFVEDDEGEKPPDSKLGIW